MRLGIAEIIKDVVNMDNEESKINYLLKHNSVTLQKILKYTYDGSTFILPASAPPWKKNHIPNQIGRLYQETRMIDKFLSGGEYDFKKINKVKVENIFINLLESIDDADAEIMVNMICKKPIVGLPKYIVEKAFPGIFA